MNTDSPEGKRVPKVGTEHVEENIPEPPEDGYYVAVDVNVLNNNGEVQ